MKGFAFLRNSRVLLLTAVLLAQALLFYSVSHGEEVALHRPLEEFPRDLPGWSMVSESRIEDAVLEVLRADDTLNRTYSDAGRSKIASLFVAYFESQREGQTPHSPKHCLPGAGWTPSESDVVPIEVAGRDRPIEVNRYVLVKGEQKSVVLYWYQSNQRVVASEYLARMYLVLDAIRYNRTDTALVRVIVPVPPGGETARATETASAFVQAFFGRLGEFLPA